MTKQSLVDTLLAEVGTLTTIVSDTRDEKTIGWIQEYFSEMIVAKLDLLSSDNSTFEETKTYFGKV